MVFHISETSSDSDDDLRAIINGKKADVPEDCTLDSLLATRETDIFIHHPVVESPDESSDDAQSDFVPPVTIGPMLSRDASIFDLPEGAFPMIVLSFLADCQPPDPPSYAKLPEWTRKFIEVSTDLYPKSADTLFALISELIETESPELQSLLIRYGAQFPSQSIPYRIWHSFALKAINKNICSLVGLLSVANYDSFSFKTESDQRMARTDLILLHLSSIFCPKISMHSDYSHVIPQLVNFLKRDIFDDEIWIGEVTTKFCNLATEIRIRNWSLWISMFPLEGFGSRFLLETGTRLCLWLFDSTLRDSVSIPEFVEALDRIKGLCESSDNEDLEKASAALALAEKVLIAAIRLRQVDKKTVKIMAKKLKFSFAVSDMSMMTALKEQVHVTRTQVENLSQSDLFLPRQGHA